MFGFGFFVAFFLWILAFIVLVGRSKAGTHTIAGLAGAYLVNLALPHFLSALVALLPWNYVENQDISSEGFVITGYAIFGLLAGVLVIAPLLTQRILPLIRRGGGAVEFGRVPTYALIGGLFSYFVILSLAGSIPGGTAVLSGGMHLGVAGLCLLWWKYWTEGRYSTCWWVLAVSVIFPLLTVTVQGFLGFGVTPVLMVGSFVAVHYRPRMVIALVGVFCVFFGLSVYPVYMEVRQTIRRAVWGGQDVVERVNTIYTAFASGWRWFDPRDMDSLYSIEARLNQNILIGYSVRNLEGSVVQFAHGETLVDAALALIPRFIWPDKPERAGSRGLVSRFTGLEFAEGTSVGIGHIMEFYINFGIPGVLIGFLIFGSVIGALDIVAGESLQRGNWTKFVFAYVLGAAATNVGGNFAEMTASMLGCMILTFIVTRFAVPTNIPAAHASPMSLRLRGRREEFRPKRRPPNELLPAAKAPPTPQLPAPIDQ